MKQVYSFEDLIAEPDSFVKLYSRRLNQTVIILNDEATVEHHSGTYALYRAYEILAMRHLSEKEIFADNRIRREFQGIPLKKSEMEEINNERILLNTKTKISVGLHPWSTFHQNRTE